MDRDEEMMNCKEATLLIVKKQEGKLSWGDKIRLRFHVMMCKFCKLFENDVQLIDGHIHDCIEEYNIDYRMSEPDKNHIKNELLR